MAINSRTPQEVVAAYHHALDTRDFDAARAVLRNDLRFKGPFDEFQTADDYLEAVRGLWGIVESIEVKHQSSARDEVVVLYEMATRTQAGRQLVCEWFGVENGSIVWIRAVFDTAPFAFLRS
jgi:limonene-1,2-epoxide hydrolase